jgi:non-heme chloroperoxidase
MMATFTALASGSLTVAKEPLSKAVSLSSTMIESRDGTRIHFRDWGAGRPIVFVAPWGLCSDWWDIPVITLSERGWRC